MATTPDTLLVTGETMEQVSADSIYVTPSGGTQTTLAAALATATGGAVSATTLTASSTVTLSPASHNVVLSPTGTGVVTINPATAGTMNNVSVGVTTPLAGKFTTITSATNAAVVLTNQSSGAAAGAGTLTNAPAAGDPNFWLPISINGTAYWIPAWHA